MDDHTSIKICRHNKFHVIYQDLKLRFKGLIIVNCNYHSDLCFNHVLERKFHNIRSISHNYLRISIKLVHLIIDVDQTTDSDKH